MKNKLIYTLIGIVVVGVVGTSYAFIKATNTNVTTNNNAITNNDSVAENKTENKDTSKVSSDNEGLKDADSKFTYTITEENENGTVSIKSNNKIILSDLKHKIADTDKYLIYAKIGENNTPNSEIVDWDIAFLNKNTGNTEILKDAQYTEIYVEYSKLCDVDGNTLYGVLDDTNTLFKIDLTKDNLIREEIEKSPKIKNIAGIYIKKNLVFLVDENDAIVSYNTKTGQFKNHKYFVGTTGENKSFTEIDSNDVHLKEFKFTENYTDEIYKNKDGLELYINRDEENEQFAFFMYDENTNDFHIYQ